MRFCLTPPFFAPSLLAVLMASTLMMGTPAQAAPAVDELDNWLANKGLLSQMSQASQSVTNKASELVVHAMGFLGVPYQRGGGTFETGFDCSGFVKAIFEQTVGLVLPRKAEQQSADTQRIDKKELVPGDLVFFNTMHRAYSHVGIYVGDGKFIHSPKPGAEVRIESMGAAYWNRRFDGARRVDTNTATSALTFKNLQTGKLDSR
jgi:cell wall-associated NlpC family hydrolase